MVDQLAQEYAGQSVVFLEYDVDSTDFWTRNSRFWAAYGSGVVTLPEIIVDSGNQVTNGYEDFYTVYKGMVDTALARPAQADVTAQAQRSGDKVKFSVQVTNLSGVTLSSSSNWAAVHGVVYEDVDPGVALTGRYVRAAVSTDISNLAPGEKATFTLETSELSGVDWDKLHFLALVDYRPGGSSGAYDMLQAAYALAPTVTVDPDTVTFMVDPSDSAVPSAPVSFEGPDSVDWTAIASTSWVTVTPPSGSTAIQPAISVLTSSLSAGWQQGHITFTTPGGLFMDQVQVKAYYGPVKRIYLPFVIR